MSSTDVRKPTFLKHTSRGKRYVFAVVVILLAQLALQSGNAQTAGTGAISGTVTDSSGAVVPAANISVANIDTGETRSTASQTNGVYRVALLPPGSYRVDVSKTGYKTWS